MLKAFPKIFTIGTKYIQDIFKDEVEITEKVDGSQFVFGRVGGELFCRSKGKEMPLDAPEKMFQLAVDYVKKVADQIIDGRIYYCEFLSKCKHNALEYGRVPRNNLIVFGVEVGRAKDDTAQAFIGDYPRLANLADELELEAVPLVFRGKINDAQQLLAMLDRESVLGKAKIEGVVVKNYQRSYWLGDQIMPITTGKYVSEAFKEVHHKTWAGEHTGKGRWELFKDSFRTEARWGKAVQHLKEQGILTNTPVDIGALIKAVQKDIDEEEKDAIKDFLWKEFGQEVTRKATAGLPQWYKEQLLKASEFIPFATPVEAAA